MGGNAEKFAALGVTAKDPLEAFKQLSDVFSSIKDPQLRAKLGAEALGKSWESAAPLLAEGSAKIQDMVTKGTELSGMTQDMADKADEFNDKMAELKTTLGGLVAGSASDILEIFKAMSKDMSDVTTSASGLTDKFNPLTETIKALVVFGSDIAFVFKGIGNTIGGVAAQIGALISLDFSRVAAIQEMIKSDDKKNRDALDKWQAGVMAAGTTAKQSAAVQVAATKEIIVQTPRMFFISDLFIIVCGPQSMQHRTASYWL
jgi:hypothetical protein